MLLIRTIIRSSKFTNCTNSYRSFAQKIQQDTIFEKLQNADAGIAVFSLNRPRQKNSLGLNLLSEFEETLKVVQHDSEVRVLLIRSLVPGIFCAGADLKERAKLSEDEVLKLVNRLRALTSSIANLPCPVIAALDGIALGGGLEIALGCDIRTASTTVKLGLVETKLAIIPGAGGTQRLPRTINTSLAKELIYTAKIVDGAQAEKIGLVNHAVKQNQEGDAAYQKALEIAREIIPNGPFAVRIAKEAINKGLDLDLKNALDHEGVCYAKIIPTKDRTEGLAAFNEKRAPKYTGQ